MAASIQSGQLVIQAISQSLMILLTRGLLDNSSQHINISSHLMDFGLTYATKSVEVLTQGHPLSMKLEIFHLPTEIIPRRSLCDKRYKTVSFPCHEDCPFYFHL